MTEYSDAKNGLDRRTFLHRAGLMVLGASTAPVAAAIQGANDRVNIGVIGCNSMGFRNVTSMLQVPGTRCIALCDIDSNVLDRRAAELTDLTGQKPRIYADYRALLDDPDVDALIIGTPDHWHCLQMVHACEAGKDVYVEKPLGNSIAECERMVAAQKRYDRVVQVGQWRRSAPHWAEAIELVHSGSLGTIRTVKAWSYVAQFPIPRVTPDEAVPAGVDYDMWLGPAPSRPFNRNRFHFNFRWYWDYAGGLMTDRGVHLIDIALWGMRVDHPRRIMSSGGNFADPDSDMETPDTQQAIYEYDGFTLIWEHAIGIGGGLYRRGTGVAFLGENGTLVVDRGGWELFPETGQSAHGQAEYRMAARPVRKALPTEFGLNQHTANFIECVRDRTVPNCDASVGSLVAVNAQLGNIALRTGDNLDWDGESLRFRDNRAANEFLKPEYRRPWRFPD